MDDRHVIKDVNNCVMRRVGNSVVESKLWIIDLKLLKS